METEDGQFKTVDELKELVNKSVAEKRHRDVLRYGRKYIDLQNEDRREEMEVSLHVAEACYKIREYDDVVTHCDTCIAIATELPNEEIEKKAKCLLELVKSKKSIIDKNGEEALTHNEEAIKIAKDISEKRFLIFSYFEMGWAYYNLCQYNNVMSPLEEACLVAQDIGDKGAELEAYLHMNANYRLANNPHTQAICNGLEKALAISKELNHKDFMMVIYLEQVVAYRSLGQEEDATEALENYFAVADDMGNTAREHSENMVLSFLRGTGQEFIDHLQDLAQNKQVVSSVVSTLIDKLKLNSISGIRGSAFLQEMRVEMYRRLVKGDTTEDIEFIESHFHDFGFELIGLSICYDCTMMSLYQRFLGQEFWVKFVAQTAGRFKFVDMTNESTGRFFIRVLKLVIVATDPNIIHGINRDIMKLNDINSMIDFGKSLADVADIVWQDIMEEGGPVFDFCKEQKALALSHWGVTLYFFGQTEEAEKFLRGSVDQFESIFDALVKVENYQMSVADRFLDTYKMLFKVLMDMERYNEALSVADRCHAKALKSCLILKHKVTDKNQIVNIDIESLVVEEKCAILFYTWCFNDLYIFLVQRGSKNEKNDLKFYIQRDVKQKIDEKVAHVLGIMNVLSTRDTKTAKETSDGSRTQPCTCCESIRAGPPSENDDHSYPPDDEASAIEDLRRRLEELHKLLLSPIKSDLTAEEVVIVPEESLYLLPFAALLDPAEDHAQVLAAKRYFSQDKQLRFSPSIANVILHHQVQDDYYNESGSLIIGDPDISEIPNITSLRGSEDEAKTIAEIIGGITPCIGRGATKHAVLERISEVSIIHFACHMRVQDEHSAIILTPSNNPVEERDFQLTPEEISKEQVRAKLVVLSGCNSGRGRISAEGVIGLARAFLAAGAGAVLVSRWKVDDFTTKEFMTNFYTYLLDWDQRRSVNESLQLTINDMRGKYADRPDIWSGFFLMGNDVTIDRDSLSILRPN